MRLIDEITSNLKRINPQLVINRILSVLTGATPSYATRRDLWEWTVCRMRNDSERLIDIKGRPFDHGGNDPDLRAHSMISAIQWIESVVHSRITKAAVDQV